MQAKAIGLAVLTSGIALTSALAMSRGLQRRAQSQSYAQPLEESWFEGGPPPTAAQIAAGKKLFLNNCAHCHGIDARGDEGPDLHEVQSSDRYITHTILRGVPHEMPAFGKKLSAGDVNALVAFVRSLEAEPAVDSTASDVK